MSVKLDPSTKNKDMGLYFRKTGRIVLDKPFGEIANWVKVTTAGDIVWKNSNNGESGVYNLEAGESAPIMYTEILTNGVGPLAGESTTAGGLLYAVATTDLG